MALDIVIMGPPGAGKGTQAALLADRYGIPVIATGDMLREAAQSGTELGRRLKAVMDSGELVGDDLIIDIVRERLARPDTAKGFVLDGFPRTIRQAEALDAMIGGRDLLVLNIAVPFDEIVRRLSLRRICGRCGAIADPEGDSAVTRCARCGGPMVERSDDGEGVVRERLKVYERSTRPLLDYYGSRPSFRTINGLQPPRAVARSIAEALEENAGTGRKQ